MAATYTLGRDYTVDGLAGATDLEFTRSGERIDVTTRSFNKPVKQTVAGLEDLTFSCTVYATQSTVFQIGKAYDLTLNGDSVGLMICMDANREEPQEGVVMFKLTLKFGQESETDNLLDVGPGTYRS